MKRIAITVLVLMAFVGTGLAQDLSIRNFLRVNEEFCTAGQPTIDQLSELKDDGIRAILNLRTPGEHDAAAEADMARALGMSYFNIPVAGSDVADGQVEEFLRLTDDESNQPMFIHCASANRVGAFWLIRRVLRDGWDLAEAEEEAARIGLRSAALKEFALRYIETHGLK